jgi:DNA-directed RNA polymerase specialized sigma24 family protein
MYILKRKLELKEEQQIFIHDKVLSLPLEEKVATYLYFWKQYSHFQIALETGLPVNNIRELIENAKLRLRADLFEIASEYFETYAPVNNFNNCGV